MDQQESKLALAHQVMDEREDEEWYPDYPVTGVAACAAVHQDTRPLQRMFTERVRAPCSPSCVWLALCALPSCLRCCQEWESVSVELFDVGEWKRPASICPVDWRSGMGGTVPSHDRQPAPWARVLPHAHAGWATRHPPDQVAAPQWPALKCQVAGGLTHAHCRPHVARHSTPCLPLPVLLLLCCVSPTAGRGH